MVERPVVLVMAWRKKRMWRKRGRPCDEATPARIARRMCCWWGRWWARRAG
jgi:hypothetical protein